MTPSGATASVGIVVILSARKNFLGKTARAAAQHDTAPYQALHCKAMQQCIPVA
jgi:hypothetical protein